MLLVVLLIICCNFCCCLLLANRLVNDNLQAPTFDLNFCQRVSCQYTANANKLGTHALLQSRRFKLYITRGEDRKAGRLSVTNTNLGLNHRFKYRHLQLHICTADYESHILFNLVICQSADPSGLRSSLIISIKSLCDSSSLSSCVC